MKKTLDGKILMPKFVDKQALPIVKDQVSLNVIANINSHRRGDILEVQPNHVEVYMIVIDRFASGRLPSGATTAQYHTLIGFSMCADAIPRKGAPRGAE